MTKKQFIIFANNRGYYTSYSGRLRKFFLKKFDFSFIMNVQRLINERAYTGKSILNNKPLINI